MYGRQDGGETILWESYVKVSEREWPQIILCLALVDILGSHEVTSCIFEMAATKALFFTSAPTSGSHTLVGKIFR